MTFLTFLTTYTNKLQTIGNRYKEFNSAPLNFGIVYNYVVNFDLP